MSVKVKKRKFNLKKKTLRTLFFGIEEKKKETGKLSEKQEEILEHGLIYIQMRLPVEKITEEFETNLKARIEHKIYNAKIRVATEKDLECVKDIYNRSWLTSNTPFRPIDKDTLQKIFEDPDSAFLIAKTYGTDGGFVILDFEGENNEFGVIAGLGILPRFQRKGLGTVLGLAAWNYFKKRGLKELRCEVYKDNHASYKFIKGLQFEEFGRKTYRREDFLLDKQ